MPPTRLDAGRLKCPRVVALPSPGLFGSRGCSVTPTGYVLP